MNIRIRIITYIITVTFILLGLKLIESRPPVMPHGLYLSTQSNNIVPLIVKKDISLYEELPAQARVMGNINIMMNAKDMSDQSKQEIIDYAKKLATENGANALVVKNFFIADSEGGKSYLFFAQAISRK